MSSLEELGILGIRSFPTEWLQTIKFDGPLTLIVGANGSGKTTIIECLKYLTTGELPPNSKGGAFVHDPDLVAERATKAQVRLVFKATDGAIISATRNLELTIKPRGARSMTTLECNWAEIKKNGEKSRRSTRASELDAEIPRRLGVSKAILESVIFCHQEESLWPMSEPAALKKRFDEIFEAQKYIKAIDHLKKMGKDKTALHKLAEKDRMYLAENKKTAAGLRKRQEQLLKEMGQIDEKIGTLARQAEDAEENEFSAMKAASEFEGVIQRLKGARTNRDMLQNQVQKLKRDLKQRSEPDEVLQQELDEFEERMSLQTQQLNQQTELYERLRGNINQKINDIGSKKMQAGKFEAQKAEHERNIKDREAAIRKSANEHDIQGYASNLNDIRINEYMERITKLSKDQISKLDRLRLDNQDKQKEAQTLLDRLRQQQTALEANRSAKKDQITSNTARLNDAHKELSQFSVDEAGLARIQEQVREIEASMQLSQSRLAQSNIDSKLRNASAEIQQLEIQESSLTAEFREASKKAADLAAVDVLKKNLKTVKRDLASKVETYKENLNELLGSGWDIADIQSSFQRVQREVKEKVAGAKRKHDGAVHDVERLDDGIQRTQSNITARQQEADRCANQIQEGAQCPPNAFLAELEDAKQSRDNRQTDVDSFMGMKQFFQDAISMAEQDKKCKLCRRGFKETKEITAVVSSLRRQFSDTRQEELQAQLTELSEDLAAMEELRPAYSTWLRLTSEELPPLREDLQRANAERTQLVLRRDMEEEAVAEAEEKQREVEQLSTHVMTISGYRSEIVRLETELEQANAREGLTGSLRTIDDINTELEQARLQIKDLRVSITKYQAEERQLREQISKYAVELGEAKNRQDTANHHLQNKATVNKQIAGFKQGIQELRQSILSLDSELGDLLPEIQSKVTELNRQRNLANEEERAANDRANKLSAEVKELMQLDYNIAKYSQEGGSANLARSQREIQALEAEKNDLENESRDITIKVSKMRDEISNQDRVKRIIMDNLEYRKAREDLKTLEQEIAEMVAQNAEADQEQHRREAHRWQQLKDSANTARVGEMVRKKEKDSRYNEIVDDIEEHYKNVDQRYTQANIEVVTLSKIIKDLSTYATALNNAIMEYHGTKMEQINRIIAELWTATYQGTDIDTICIRSEHEVNKSNRSYNYRVTMMKQNVEMDMRGRCSAGQRVLASIIIRLALAECFSEYCGIIALDEPTTNLDRENIRSLAESLHEIIKVRKSQANFQLIVITHDEDFLKVMRPSDHADRFYRVQRDQRQKSKIDRKQMFEL